MTTQRHSLLLSFVLATHNRRAVVVDTLQRLASSDVDRADYEIIVVDNASNDDTAEAIGGLCDNLIRLDGNVGSCAKADGISAAHGKYIIFLDDDSYPHPGAVERMIAHFEADPQLGAAGFQVHLPDGGLEGGALPDVFLGCGVGTRSEALRGAGGLDRSFFMQAEEYDLAFRLVASGWKVRTFDDLHVDHLKTIHARRSSRTVYYDIRNNLRVAARYLPESHYGFYRNDWRQRYAWLAARAGHSRSHRWGSLAGRCYGTYERPRYRDVRLDDASLERFFGWEMVRRRMTELVDAGANRIVFADLGKNVYAFHRAATLCGVNILAIGDDRFAERNRRYRGVPILDMADALALGADAIVVANSSPVHAASTRRRLIDNGCTTVHDWFGTDGNASEESSGLCRTPVSADDQVADSCTEARIAH